MSPEGLDGECLSAQGVQIDFVGQEKPRLWIFWSIKNPDFRRG